jgi:hypothetical protein
MPYHIRKKPNDPSKAKVYTQDLRSKRAGQDALRAYDGTPLSKKWLTVQQAEKQMYAVILAELNRKKQ